MRKYQRVLPKSLSDVRDGLLIAGAVFYGVGYVVWSVNSLVFGLGLLPALDVQYFVAGLVPILALSLAFLLRGLVRESVERSWAWVEARPWLRVLLEVGVGAAVGYGYTVLFGLDWRFALGFAGAFVLSRFLGQLAPTPPSRPSGMSSAPRDWGPPVARGLGLTLPWLLAIVLIATFVAYAYPSIPQELGGVRPRCAFLDLLRDEVSSDTLTDLGAQTGEGSDQGSGPAVVRSAEVYVYFDGGGSILVKRERSRGAETFDLSTDAVRATVSCPNR